MFACKSKAVMLSFAIPKLGHSNLLLDCDTSSPKMHQLTLVWGSQASQCARHHPNMIWICTAIKFHKEAQWPIAGSQHTFHPRGISLPGLMVLGQISPGHKKLTDRWTDSSIPLIRLGSFEWSNLTDDLTFSRELF